MTNLWEFVEREIGPIWAKQKDPTPSHTQQTNVDEDLMLFNQAIMIATTKSGEVSHC